MKSLSVERHLALQKKPVYELKLTTSEMKRIVEWALQKHRKPAIIAFTAGAARDTARVFEAYFDRFKQEKV